MVARFILSLDGEGKWGMADMLTPALHAQLADAPLKRAYHDILALLEHYRIPATFAFVGCFSLTRPQLDAARPKLEALAQTFPDYLNPALADLDNEGWCGAWAIEAVQKATLPHEVALHGMTHIPWNHPAMNEATARAELALGADFPISRIARTYIYPRNAIAWPHLLSAHGIIAYREARTSRSRLLSLLSEFNLFSKPQADPAPALPLPIPAGYFINWKHGLRRLVPTSATRLRFRLMLRRAARTGGIVHAWTHPENIATAPATLGVLRAILAEVAALRDAGQCEILTQQTYAASCNAKQPSP